MLFCITIPLKKTFIFFTKIKYELFIALLLTIFALLFYSFKVGEVTPGIWGDEIIVAQAGEKILSESSFSPFTYHYVGHPTPLLYLAGFFIKTFGKSLWTIRIDGIIFGAMSVGALYFLIRLFYDKKISLITSILFCFCYPFVAISRFAYDISAFVFMETISAVFIYLAYSKKNWRYVFLSGISIGTGLYTYYAYKLFAFAFLILTAIVVVKYFPRDKLKVLIILFISFFVSSLMYFSFGLTHPDQLFSRASKLFVFGQSFSLQRSFLEFLGNVKNDLGALFFTADTNPRQNPAGGSYFDIITVFIYITGLFGLVKKNKKFLIISLILCFIALLNDLLTVEIFPEFHFYGTGHPNTLRISGIIPIVFFWFATGLNSIKKYLFKQANAPFIILLLAILFFDSWFNLYKYFGQQQSPNVYKDNGVAELRIANAINKSLISSVSLSKSLYYDPRIIYFTNRSVKMTLIPTTTLESVKEIVLASDNVIIDPLDNITLGGEIASKLNTDYFNKQPQFIFGPFGEVDDIIFSNSNITIDTNN